MNNYTNEQREKDLLGWFFENNFTSVRVKFYMKKFSQISSIENIQNKRKAFFEFQQEILREFDSM